MIPAYNHLLLYGRERHDFLKHFLHFIILKMVCRSQQYNENEENRELSVISSLSSEFSFPSQITENQNLG